MSAPFESSNSSSQAVAPRSWIMSDAVSAAVANISRQTMKARCTRLLRRSARSLRSTARISGLHSHHVAQRLTRIARFAEPCLVRNQPVRHRQYAAGDAGYARVVRHEDYRLALG